MSEDCCFLNKVAFLSSILCFYMRKLWSFLLFLVCLGSWWGDVINDLFFGSFCVFRSLFGDYFGYAGHILWWSPCCFCLSTSFCTVSADFLVFYVWFLGFTVYVWIWVLFFLQHFHLNGNWNLFLFSLFIVREESSIFSGFLHICVLCSSSQINNKLVA